MNLAYFPFDSQMCTVEIESFGYTMADLKYSWYRWVSNTNQYWSLIGQHSIILFSYWSKLNDTVL